MRMNGVDSGESVYAHTYFAWNVYLINITQLKLVQRYSDEKTTFYAFVMEQWCIPNAQLFYF